MDEWTPIKCPFCHDNDFDAIGLKAHLLNGWCEEFEAVETLQQEFDRKKREEQ